MPELSNEVISFLATKLWQAVISCLAIIQLITLYLSNREISATIVLAIFLWSYAISVIFLPGK